MKFVLSLLLITWFCVSCSTAGSDVDGYLPTDGRAGFLYFFTEG